MSLHTGLVRSQAPVCAILKISPRMLYKLPLPFVKFGRAVRWRLSDIESRIRSNTVHRAVPPDLRTKQGRAWIDETSTRVTKAVKEQSGGLRPMSYYLGLMDTESGRKRLEWEQKQEAKKSARNPDLPKDSYFDNPKNAYRIEPDKKK
jgi:hypothetical protein